MEGIEISDSNKWKKDEEEALKWEDNDHDIVQTYNNNVIRRGSDDERIISLSMEEKRSLLDRLMNIPQEEEDNHNFLLKLKQRFHRVGIEFPKIEVRFEHLNVEAEAYAGTRALPTMFNFTINMIEGALNYFHVLPKRKKSFSILNDVSGIIKPGRMTLLLGPPGCGKTTLLLALAGKLNSDVKVSGKVSYNGNGMDEFVPERTCAYISQDDVHLANLTVRETLEFSARCQGVGPRYEMLEELLKREKEANIKPDPDIDMFMKAASVQGKEPNIITDYTLKILGLEICAETLVGDEMVRGISGGQLKRLTTGEMMVGPARALFMDEISTGLDSSTTFQIVKSIRQSIHILKGTALISLLQPAPETYGLFDDVILLADGRIVYQGPREHVLEFFEYVGFKCPRRKGVADFLQEVTSRKDQEQYWARTDEPYKFVSSREFFEAFQSFHVGRVLANDLSVPFDKANKNPDALTTNKYGVKKRDLLKACMSREILLMKRNIFVYLFKIIQHLLLASITMTLFLRIKMPKETQTDGFIFMGALFFTVIAAMFNGCSEVPFTILKLPVFFKQHNLLFFPVWAYTLPAWIVKIPISIIESSIWVSITYYAIGFDPNIVRFSKQLFLVICVDQMASGLFRFMAAVGRKMIIANTLGSLALLLVLVMGGFIMDRDDVKKWWLWGYWCSPMMYAQNAITVNEFLGNSWSNNVPDSTDTLGVVVLKSRAMFPDAQWYWIGVGAVLGYVVFFNFMATLALTYLKPFGKSGAVLPDEKVVERNTKIRNIDIKSSTGEMKNEGKRTAPIRETKSIKKGGMILPFQPLSLVFDDIRYAVDVPQDIKPQGVLEARLELLKEISGAFRPGVLTALMGISGAGKTTLMDVLAGRKTHGYIEGSITISGYPKKQETFARIAGYCEQTDIHSPNLTVHESLQFSAWLRLPQEVDSATRKMFIEEVMDLVELTPLKEALVGLPSGSGLSVEQRKRLTIAVELVANPSIIFMDEPTSGLDARAAAIVMRTVRNTVDTGRTVVCTIHQPSIDIFDAFDELVLLKQGGEEIYVGPLGHHSSELIKYFEGINGVPKIKDGYNPATWVLEITSKAQEAALGVNFAVLYKSSELYRNNKSLIREASISTPGSKELNFSTKYSRSFFNQCIACLWKQHWSYWRNPSYTAVRILFTSFTALMFGTVFWDLGSRRRRKQDLFNAAGSMYASVLFLGIQNASVAQPVVSIERTVFYRERAAGMYSAFPYAFGQIVIELPYILVQTVVFGVIAYGMIGFEWTIAKFFWYQFFMFFTLLYFTLYGMMTVAVTPNLSVAGIISNFFYAMWNLFSGFVVPKTRIPMWWRWYYYVCPVSWTLYGLVASQFGDLTDELEENLTLEQFVKSYFGFESDFVPYVAIIVIAFCILFAFIFAFSIKAFNFQRK
ncbi:hypothetical protein MTR67_052655 [Solanum verrucosum]|uniref:ABC transporter domain-containing protein n=1 Tax=Solanum verrucosum TaxID=315347 RepID=A0AAF1A3F4_SOLVR|nr:hypothetical protein MTR67_052655 [Solanum verrucosum]